MSARPRAPLASYTATPPPRKPTSHTDSLDNYPDTQRPRARPAPDVKARAIYASREALLTRQANAGPAAPAPAFSPATPDRREAQLIREAEHFVELRHLQRRGGVARTDRAGPGADTGTSAAGGARAGLKGGRGVVNKKRTRVGNCGLLQIWK